MGLHGFSEVEITSNLGDPVGWLVGWVRFQEVSGGYNLQNLAWTFADDVDTIPRSIRKVDGVTEVWLVLSMLTGLGGTRVNTNPALAMENMRIAAIPNSNVWCDAD